MSQRKSNLELLRVVSMCGIVIMHYFGMGGAIRDGSFPGFSWFLNHGLNALCIPLVNCFVLITGYFLIERTTFAIRKPLELLLITAFYGAISYVIWLCTKEGYWSVEGLLEAIFPFIIGKRWFVETYIILLLLGPFLSAMLKKLPKKQFLLLLGVQLTIFSLWYSLGLSAPILDDGYGIINFITLYMLGGYIRLHGADTRCLGLAKGIYGALYLICSFTTFVLSYFINPYGYAFVVNILGAVCIFLYFLRWDLGMNRIINRVSQASFDVYFVHSDHRTAYLLFYHLLHARLVVDTPWMLPHLLLVILAVWLLGILCHSLRKRLFSYTVDRLLDKCTFLNRKINIAE